MESPDRKTLVIKSEDTNEYGFIDNLSPVKPILSGLKESGLLNRHNPLEASKPKVSSEDANSIYSSEEALVGLTYPHNNSSELQEIAHQGVSAGYTSIDELYVEHTKRSVQLPQALQYCGFPVHDPPPFCADETNYLLALPSEAASEVAYVPESCKTNSVEGERHHQEMSQMDLMGEGQFFEWDGYIPDDILNFYSLGEAEAYKAISYTKLVDASLCHSEPTTAATDTDHMQDNTHAALMTDITNDNEGVDSELVSVMHRCRWQRIGASVLEAEERIKSMTNEKQLLPINHNTNATRCFLPSVGLLAALKNNKGIQNERSSFRRPLGLEYHQRFLSLWSDKEVDPVDNPVQPAEDCSLSSGHIAGEDFNQNSPRKKRRKLEPARETEGCKHCNCKNSKCLKLYCNCFTSGVYCMESCNCQGCFNKPIHKELVIQTRRQIESRNPSAFTPKVITTQVGDDPNTTPAPARHKKGCNCKKSSCTKKYCECYQGGVGCSINCRCEGCKNTNGTKDGTATPMRIEAFSEETETCEVTSMKNEIQSMEKDHPPVSVSTPSSSLLLPLPFSSEVTQPQPRSFVTTISGSGLFASQPVAAGYEEMQNIVGGYISSPMGYIKTSSPNGKRISSPNMGQSRKGGRKLKLRSIPSFPSL